MSIVHSHKGYQLKSVKKFRGHEGEPLWQADLWFNKTKVLFWSDDSHGGELNVQPYGEAYRKSETYLEWHKYLMSLDMKKRKLDDDLEYYDTDEQEDNVYQREERVLGELFENWELQQHCKKMVLFRDKGSTEDEWRTYKIDKKAGRTEALLIAHVRTKHGDVEILNELLRDAA